MRTFILTIVLALFAAPSLAQHTRDYSDQLPEDLPPFEEADQDGDGLIDWEEAEEIGIPRDVFNAEQQGGYLAEPTYRYAIRRENP